MKLERKAYATYIDATFGGSGSPVWFLIGKDIEELSVELNPDIETIKNILGETSIKDNGYEPQFSADPYYANPDDAIYEKIKAIAMERLKGDQCKTKVLEVIITDDSGQDYEGYTEDVIVKPQSYGGGTDGFAIPFDVHFNGNRKKGTVDISEGVPTFSA